MALSYLSQPGKQVKLSDGTNYAYLYIPAKPTKSTFLLLHGFPSSSYDWRHQVEALSSKGFGLLIPDLLGYGDTDAPKSVEAYAQKLMAGHMAEILDKESLTKVIGVAHDWYVYGNHFALPTETISFSPFFHLCPFTGRYLEHMLIFVSSGDVVF
jgi:soluble epoxide hydrolase/lipid-phosphate phosphatase